jgi:hypothetical protein
LSHLYAIRKKEEYIVKVGLIIFMIVQSFSFKP